MKTIEAVKCDVCGELHDIKADTFISVHGNVCVGMGGGVIGNNLENDTVKNVSIYCRKKKCFRLFDSLLEDKPTPRGLPVHE